MYRDGGSFSEGYVVGRDTANNNSWSNGFGGDWAWFIILALIFGWGNGNGFGLGNGGAGNMVGYELGKVATTNDVASGFSTSTIMSNQRDLQLGQANGFAAVQQTLCQGFNGVNTAILQSANATQAQIADCCCKLERGIDGINYNMAKNTCDIIQSGRDNTQRIIDFLTNDKIESLRQENTLLTNQLSQNSQTSTIINTLRPVAQPAYLTCSPFASAYGLPYGYGNYGNSGCGCSGCGSF